MIEFKQDPQGQIHFRPSSMVAESLTQKMDEAEQVLLLATSKGGLRLPCPAPIVVRHPYAHLLAAYRKGMVSSNELGETPLTLTHLSETDIEALSDGELLVAQDIHLLSTKESRGQSFTLAPWDALAEVRFRNNMTKLATVLGPSWAAFIRILSTITFVDVAAMPGLPYFSGSSSATFGAMHMIHSENTLILAECITHEAAHTWLSLVDGKDHLARDMWNEDTPWISPWREDPRPIGGVVHGVFVFSCVLVVLVKLLEQALDTSETARVRKRLARIASQVEEGITLLRASDLLTEAGYQLCVDSEARLNITVPATGGELAEARSAVRAAHQRKHAAILAAKESHNAKILSSH